jgi:hypothetical protein
VTSAGNGGTKEDPSRIIDEWPPSFGADSLPYGPPAINDLIVVGATNERGWLSPISKENFFMDIIYAPGDGVLIPDGSGTATKTRRGTSFCEYSLGPLSLVTGRFLTITAKPPRLLLPWLPISDLFQTSHIKSSLDNQLLSKD